MAKKTKTQSSQWIPTKLTLAQFNEFILPHIKQPQFGPTSKITDYKAFNYILYFLHTGCQWAQLPIEKNAQGQPEIHFSRLYRKFRYWERHGCFDKLLQSSVFRLSEQGRLDTRVLHGDGTATAAKKGGDNIGFNGFKHMKGDKVVAICDRRGNVLAPFVKAPGNRNECPLFPDAFSALKKTAKLVGFNLKGSIMSLDGAYDSRANRKLIFNHGLVPNIPENIRNSQRTKRGRPRLFKPEVFKERFATIERVFGWEDKFKRLLLRFERISAAHYALKTLAYTLINLRHFV